MEQGKFSNPRPKKYTNSDTPELNSDLNPSSSDSIEDIEADIAKFLDDAIQELVGSHPSEDTKILSELNMADIPDWKDATQTAPDSWISPEHSEDLWLDETMVRSTSDWTTPEPEEKAPPKSPVPPAVQNRTVSHSPSRKKEPNPPTFFQRNRKPILVGGCAVILTLLLLIIGAVVTLNRKNADDGKILDNVMVADLNIGGMTPEQASAAISGAYSDCFATNTMVVKLPDSTLELTPQDTNISLNVDALVNAAYHYGRGDSDQKVPQGVYKMDLLPYLRLDAEYIHQVLTEYGRSYNSTYQASGYEFEGPEPGLTAETFDENAPCQTLVLTIGTPGREMDVEAVYTSVLNAYSNMVFQVDMSDMTEEVPSLPDLETIFESHCSTPVDAYMDMQTFAVTGETYGYTFDLEKAKAALAEAEFGSTVEIEMEYLYPQIVTDDLVQSLFADVLGSCETPHNSNENRNANLRLACQAISGLVLQPGDEFSFNDVVGERTSERGYRSAPAYANGETISELGGGVCQVSSTLYYAALLADLEITARQNHSYVSTYIDLGMDATVSWGGPEFKFRNSTSYPIRIEAEVSDGNVKIQLLGTDEKDYYIELEYDVAGYLSPETEYKEFDYDNDEGYVDGEVIQKGSTGYVVDSYKHKYSKETGEIISEEFITRSSYRPHNEIVASVAEPPTTEAPTEKPTEAPEETEAPTEKPTEAPEETEAPTEKPTEAPEETEAPTEKPTEAPEETKAPTKEPEETKAPSKKPDTPKENENKADQKPSKQPSDSASDSSPSSSGKPNVAG